MNKFCKTCGTLLEILEQNNYCYMCQEEQPRSDKQRAVIQEKVFIHQTASEFLQQESRPIIDEECPQCGHGKAFYEARQMRSADEGQTVFYQCMKCGFQHKTNT